MGGGKSAPPPPKGSGVQTWVSDFFLFYTHILKFRIQGFREFFSELKKLLVQKNVNAVNSAGFAKCRGMYVMGENLAVIFMSNIFTFHFFNAQNRGGSGKYLRKVC